MTSKSDGAIDSVCLILLGLLSFVAASSTILVVVQKVKAAQARRGRLNPFPKFRLGWIIQKPGAEQNGTKKNFQDCLVLLLPQRLSPSTRLSDPRKKLPA